MALLSTVIGRGVAADRPATAAAGALYFSTDTGTLERYSGAAWQSYSAEGSFSPVGHTHTAADVTAGTLATARLGSGAASASTFLRGDGAWAAIPSSSRLLYAQPSVEAGDTVANTTTRTTFASKVTIPSASFVVGRVFRVTAAGVWRDNNTSPNLLLALLFGSTTMIANTTPLTGVTQQWGWRFDADITIRAIGVSGSAEARGKFAFAVSDTAERTNQTGGSIEREIDTTADRDLTLQAEWSAAHANNTITLRSLIVEQLS